MGIDAKMTALADAVRAKSGVTGKLSIDGMTAAVNGISTGGGGGSADFYKCASVDTTAKTWTGYKAVLTDGVYSFEDTVTEGLSYGNGYTPVVGGVYTDGCLVKVSYLWEGVDPSLVFYADFKEQSEKALTGQTIVEQGSGLNYSQNGVSFNGNGYLEVSDTTGFPLSGAAFTLHAKVIFNETVSFNHILSFGNHVGIRAWENQLLAFTNSGDLRKYDISSNVQYTVDIAYDGTHLKLYVDKEFIEQSEWNLNIGSGSLTIGRGNGYNGWGSITDLKIYNRALSAEEIAEE
ncbi:MAG: LamG domain-containing protein [Oscillospiraceae bacterium]|nr:LamG domain-containing protein [Oscillospiraceae bacterium]